MAMELRKTPRETVSGPAFDALVKAFDDIMTKGKADPIGLNELKFATQDLFTVEVQSVYFPVWGQVSSYKFYGFRVFPYPIETELDNEMPSKIVIEIDPRLANDYSHHLNPNEVAMLYIYHLTEIFPDVELNNRIRFLHKAYMTPDNIDWRIVHLYSAQNPTVYQLNNMLALYRYYWVNYKKSPIESSLVSGWNDSMAIYSSAVNKLIKAYGTLELVDRSKEEFDRGALGIVKLIYESINDLKHSAFRFRKNIVNVIKTTSSPYGRKVLTDLYHNFSNKVDMVFAEESTQFIGHRNVEKKTKDMIAIENANIDAYWKNRMKALLENVEVQFLDRNGMALKCSKLEVDELRVQVNDIDSTDDKIFLLEKVHKNLGIIDNALMMLKMPDKKHRVRQSETELRNLRSELELIREKIFKTPVGSTRYGLFIKYPEGYEG